MGPNIDEAAYRGSKLVQIMRKQPTGAVIECNTEAVAYGRSNWDQTLRQ